MQTFCLIEANSSIMETMMSGWLFCVFFFFFLTLIFQCDFTTFKGKLMDFCIFRAGVYTVYGSWMVHLESQWTIYLFLGQLRSS